MINPLYDFIYIFYHTNIYQAHLQHEVELMFYSYVIFCACMYWRERCTCFCQFGSSLCASRPAVQTVGFRISHPPARNQAFLQVYSRLVYNAKGRRRRSKQWRRLTKVSACNRDCCVVRICLLKNENNINKHVCCSYVYIFICRA